MFRPGNAPRERLVEREWRLHSSFRGGKERGIEDFTKKIGIDFTVSICRAAIHAISFDHGICCLILLGVRWFSIVRVGFYPIANHTRPAQYEHRQQLPIDAGIV